MRPTITSQTDERTENTRDSLFLRGSQIKFDKVYCGNQVQVQVKNLVVPPLSRTQVHYNCHIKTMSYAVKRQGEIKSFQFLLEGSCADFVSDVSRESVPRRRDKKRERSLAEFCSKAWHVIQAAVSRSQTSRRSGRSWLNHVCQIHR